MTMPVSAALPGMLLAAGASRRMGCCKLTLPLNGRPLVSYALDAARAALDPLVVVLGPDPSAELVEAVTPPLTRGEAPIQLITASKAPLGQAESLKAGLRRVLELSPHAPGVMVVLGDQPLLSAPLLHALIDAFRKNMTYGGGDAPFCVAPAFEGRRGNPVILHRALFPAMQQLEGDKGARDLLASVPLHLVPWNTDACLTDVDTPELYARLARSFP